MQHHQCLETRIRHFLSDAFSGSPQHFDRYVAEQVHCWGFPEFNPGNRREYRAFFNFLLDVFSDTRWSIEQLLTSNSQVLVRLRIEGQHHEEFMGLPATGARLVMNLRVLFSLRDGVITETWMYGKRVTLATNKGQYFALQPGSDEPIAMPVTPLNCLAC
jgi:predicted ester cyclase